MSPKSIIDLKEPFRSFIMKQIGDDKERYEWINRYIKDEYDRNKKIQSKLNKYCGPLNLKEIYQGITHCYENANSLLDDSLILFGSERYSRATTLSFGAIEEIGKIAILHEMAELPKNIDNDVLKDIWKKKWNNFNDHHYKKALGKQEIWTDKLALYGGISLDPISKEMKYVDSFRQDTLYVNFNAVEKNWVLPKNSFDRDGSESILKIAKEGVERTRQHILNNLFSIESLTIRNEICSSIYSPETEHEINSILEKLNSKSEEKRLKAKKNIFIIKLTEARYKYFKVLKEKGFVK